MTALVPIGLGLVALGLVLFLGSVAMTYQANLSAVVSPTEQGSSGNVTVAPQNTTATYGATTSPEVTKQAAGLATLTSGAVTIDLTAAIGDTNGVAVNGTGLKVQTCKLWAPATNVNPIVLVTGASNGLALLGASWSITLWPGMEVQVNMPAQSQAIGSSHKTIDASGTGSADQYGYLFGMG